ncbi:hypothetical protein [Chitinophaga sancti]|uniref:6-bladed beta-propeller protein n=1 Tax=Chitinophaga sancti TaxID=1004 RepID=A0A1K1NAK6_9BACT|nr:hypothetical protein [Chitinophaga sancti]WQD63396.1 hypothetical protein U0033_03235 [Chitinophaga sancti]WQG90978.1 hypothetical protein SR876_05680 [Chitinophaga sancti]SFW32496.1 hypothetical protein SAMN05661012_01129 [Chitinophaga sancti]
MRYFWQGTSLLALLFASQLSAQVPQVQLSNTFPEPGDGFDKILLLDNSYTAYLHFDKKAGIIVNMYDPQHQVAATNTLPCKLFDANALNDSEIDGIYEINGQVVLFLQQLVKMKPRLYRLILDGKTGALVKEDQLGELPGIQHRDVVVQDNFASHDFYVAKDPRSGYYAVASFAGGELDKKETPGERVQVFQYSPDHQQIGRSTSYLPSADYPYHAYLDMAVDKDQVYLATAALRIRRNVKDTSAMIAVSKIHDTQVRYQLLPYTANMQDMHANIQYMPASQKLVLLFTNATGKGTKTSGIDMQLSYLDAGTLEEYRHQPVALDKVSSYAQEKLKYAGAYTGVPQRMITTDDGKATILFENIALFNSSGTNAWNNLHTNMNDIGIVSLDSSGLAVAGIAQIKMQIANGLYDPMFLYRRSKGQWMFRNRIQALNTTPYLSYEYLHTKHGNFVLFNDYLAYLDPGGVYTDKKPLRYLAEANAVCYNAAGERLFLFGTPETYKGFYCMLGASDYKEEKSQYVTLLITRKGENRMANIAWVQF